MEFGLSTNDIQEIKTVFASFTKIKLKKQIGFCCNYCKFRYKKYQLIYKSIRYSKP